MKNIIMTATVLFLATTAQAIAQSEPAKTTVPKTSQSEMLAAVCTSRAVMTVKLASVCEAYTAMKAANIEAELKIPVAEVKILYNNIDLLK